MIVTTVAKSFRRMFHDDDKNIDNSRVSNIFNEINLE